MMIARWHIDARFGHKQEVLNAVQDWCKNIGSQIGWSPEKTRITTGSIGALESTIELEVEVKDLSELNESWAKLAAIEAHKQWSADVEPYIVSGTPRWEVYRVA